MRDISNTINFKRFLMNRTSKMIVENYFAQRNAEGGLNVLEHLGLKINPVEISVFLANWDRCYGRNERHFLSTVCELYSGLPSENESAKRDRENEFTKKVNSTKLLGWMRE